MYDPHGHTHAQGGYYSEGDGEEQLDFETQEVIDQQEQLIAYCMEALERGEELPPELEQLMADFGIDLAPYSGLERG